MGISSMHKILIYDADVINEMIVPIGKLFEDTQEVRHKGFKSRRESCTQKSSRVRGNEDMLHFLLISSESVIRSIW